MKKFVLIPDSFKGTLSSKEICDIMKEKINAHFKGAIVSSIPVADGGEGSVDCFLSALGGQKVFVDCSGPYGEKISGFYGILDGGKVAVIEMAACAGLPMVENKKNPAKTTTFGVGELILDAIERGVKKVIVGLGGSCTNDFGCGAASACGAEFFDKYGNKFIPTGETLNCVCDIKTDKIKKNLSGVEIITMCDIDNCAFGESGAAKVFGAQKGADSAMMDMLDNGVKHLCEVVNKRLNMDLSTLKGGGAAGAMGAGMVAFFGSTLKMGIDTVLETVNIDKVLDGADVVFTGEGKIDSQSLRGKVVIGVAKASKRKGVPVIAVVGGAEGDISNAYDVGVSAVFSINRLPQDFSISRHHSKENLEFTMDNILRALKI